jgi:hypothetical protein
LHDFHLFQYSERDLIGKVHDGRFLAYMAYQAERGKPLSEAFADTPHLPDGVLVIDLVPGQQVLATSIADDVVAAIADDYVAVSVRLDPQRWTGPFSVTGADVDLYDNREESTGLLVKNARIIEAPDTTELDARSEAVITLAVPADDVGAVIDAAANGRLWAVGS